MCEKMSVYAGEKRDQVNILRLCCGCGVCGVFACCGCGVCGVFAAVLPRQYLQLLPCQNFCLLQHRKLVSLVELHYCLLCIACSRSLATCSIFKLRCTF